MVIVEFCAYGDLQSYLRHCRGVEDKYYQDLYKVPADKLGSRDLLSFAIQTARGMAHLAGMKVRVIRRIGLYLGWGLFSHCDSLYPGMLISTITL